MKELEERQLEEVSGGIRTEKNAIVDVPIDEGFFGDISVKVYLNGEYQRALSGTVDVSVRIYHLVIKASHGKKMLKVKLGEIVTKLYELDFDEEIPVVTEI